MFFCSYRGDPASAEGTCLPTKAAVQERGPPQRRATSARAAPERWGRAFRGVAAPGEVARARPEGPRRERDAWRLRARARLGAAAARAP